MYCGQSTFVKSIGPTVEAKVLRCRSWKCQTCAPARRRRLTAEAIGGNPTTFITFTLRADDPRPRDEQVKALSRCWRVIRSRITRRWKVKNVPFIAVVERTKRGTPHLHVLCRVRYIDQRWLSIAAAELLDAPVVWVERIDAHRGIARYVSKYIGKDPEQFGTCKRYWQSPTYDQRPDLQPGERGPLWQWFDRVKQPIERVAKSYVALGYAARWRSADRCSFSPPDGGWLAAARQTPGRSP